MDEDDHALEHVAGLGQIRRVTRVSLSVDIFQGDLAAGHWASASSARRRATAVLTPAMFEE
jgi:hypothetical protein